MILATTPAADRAAAFADREAQLFFHRDRVISRRQLALSPAYHLHAFFSLMIPVTSVVRK